METDGLTKEQMLSILSCFSENDLRKILSKININTGVDEEMMESYHEEESDVIEYDTMNMTEVREAAKQSLARNEDDEPYSNDENEPADYSNEVQESRVLSLDAFRARYIEIVDYLMVNKCTPEIKEELRQLSQNLYDYFQIVEDKPTKYRIVVYQNYINKLYEEEKVSITPYSSIASEFAYHFLEEAMSHEWFRKYVNARTLEEFQKKNYEDSDFQKMRRQRLLNPLKIDSQKVDDFIVVLKDYAFSIDDLITGNDGDRAVFNIADKCCESFGRREDNGNYLLEGLKYFLGDMRNYRKA